MIRVILKDGRVLQYNVANNIQWNGNLIALVSETGWCVKFNPDVVERIEFNQIKPCRVMKDQRNKKTMKVY